MGKATGIFLILAGVGSAALILPSVDRDAERQLSDVVRIAIGGGADAVRTESSTVPLKSVTVPSSSQTALPVAAFPSVAPQTVIPKGASDPLEILTKEAAAKAPVPAAAQVAMATSPPVLMVPPALVTRNTNTAPARGDDTQARTTLSRDIQRELKRVGCYEGELSGEWNSVTRRAMKAFIDKVNAALPIDEPDHILRTMIQGHPGNACGRGGSIVASAGSARLAEKPVARIEGKAESVKSTASKDVVVVPREIAIARPAVPKPAWETTVAAAPLAPPSTPLSTEGRMAMGGPVAAATAALPTGGATSQDIRNTARLAPSALAEPPTQAVKQKAVPGAIAALAAPASAGASATAPSNDFASPPVSIDALTEFDAAKRLQAQRKTEARNREDEANRRERQRQARRPPPEIFKFPSYIGITAPKPYFAAPTYSSSYSDRSSFVARYHEKSRRSGETR